MNTSNFAAGDINRYLGCAEVMRRNAFLKPAPSSKCMQYISPPCYMLISIVSGSKMAAAEMLIKADDHEGDVEDQDPRRRGETPTTPEPPAEVSLTANKAEIMALP